MYEIDVKEGISIAEFLKVAFGLNKKRKITFGIVGILVMLIVFICVGVFYNKLTSYYTASFDYQIPSFIEKVNVESGEIIGYSYLDGTPFNYNSLVTLENLNTAKNSNEKFANLDVETISDNGDVLASYSSDNAYPYSISIKKKYFRNSTDAKDFISALVQLPVTISKGLVESTENMSYLNEYLDAVSYDDKVSDLQAQADYLISSYKNLVTVSPDVYVSFEGKLVKFNELMNISQARIDALNLSLLTSEVESNHYVLNYDEEIEGLKTKLSNLTAESNKYEALIDTYKSSLTAGTAAYPDEYIKLVDQKATVDYKISVVKGYILHGNDDVAPLYDENDVAMYNEDGTLKTEYAGKPDEIIKSASAGKTSFNISLSNAYSTLYQLSNILTSVEKSIYSDSATTVYYSTNKVVEVTGNISTVITIAFSVILGIVVAGIVNLVLDLSKYKKEAETKKMAKIAEISKIAKGNTLVEAPAAIPATAEDKTAESVSPENNAE